MNDRVWDPATFTKNRELLLCGDIAKVFFAAVLDQARGHELLSDEHFTVDGTLPEAVARLKGFKAKTQKDGASSRALLKDNPNVVNTFCRARGPDRTGKEGRGFPRTCK